MRVSGVGITGKNHASPGKPGVSKETRGALSYRKVNKAEFKAQVMGEAGRQPRGITLTDEQQDV